MNFQAHVTTRLFEFVQHVVYDVFVIMAAVISEKIAYYIFKGIAGFSFNIRHCFSNTERTVQ
jgi:hypothetical protein